MKLLFLDIDGVLNWDSYVAKDWLEPVEDEWYGAHRIDPECVEVLNEVVALTGCRLVLTSTWRIRFKVFGEVNAILKSRGLATNLWRRTDKPFQLEPGGRWSKRGDEVMRFIGARPIFGLMRWAVLDDEPMNLVGDHLVLTDSSQGLLPDYIGPLVDILGVRDPL